MCTGGPVRVAKQCTGGKQSCKDSRQHMSPRCLSRCLLARAGSPMSCRSIKQQSTGFSNQGIRRGLSAARRNHNTVALPVHCSMSRSKHNILAKRQLKGRTPADVCDEVKPLQGCRPTLQSVTLLQALLDCLNAGQHQGLKFNQGQLQYNTHINLLDGRPAYMVASVAVETALGPSTDLWAF